MTLISSQNASIVVPIDQRYGALVGPPKCLSPVLRNTSVIEKKPGVTRDQGQLVRSMSIQMNAEAAHADEANTTDRDPRPEASCIADGLLTTDRSFSPERSVVPGKRAFYIIMEPQLNRTVRSPPKLRQWMSAPALTEIRHSRSGSDSTLFDSLPPSATIPLPSPPDTRITVVYTGPGDKEANQDSRAPSPSEQSNLYNVRPYQVLDAWRDRVAGSIKKITAARDMEFAERLARTVTEAKAAKDEEWSDRLEKAVAQAEAAKDEELEIFDRFKESSHSNEIKDLEEDHALVIQELEEKYATAIQEITTKHDEELSEVTRKHGLEARKLEMRRAQGAKEVKKLKDDLTELEAEKMRTEETLVHMTGQRDALSNALATMKGQSSTGAIISSEPPQGDHNHNHRQREGEHTAETEDKDSRPVTNAAADAVNETEVPATDSGPLQPYQPGQPSQPHIVPNDLYPRLRLVETENAQLREDLEHRHEDVKYAIEKADKLRALLEEDSTKADTYAELLMHKEVIENLRACLSEPYEGAEREKLESQRLRDQIDVVAGAAQRETLERLLAVKDKETAWEQNETLLKNLKGKFGKEEFDEAFWAHYESLVKEKEGLEGDIKGYKRERRDLMEEAAESRAKIAELELVVSKRDDDDGVQEFQGQILSLQVENKILKAELDYQFAEQTNRKGGRQMPRGLRELVRE